MQVLKILRGRPDLFFCLSGIRLIDCDALVAPLHPIWRTNTERISGREHQPVKVSSGVCRAVVATPDLLSALHVPDFYRIVV